MKDLLFQQLIYLSQFSKPSSEDVGLPNIGADQDFARNILGIVFGIAAAAAILVIVIAGFQLATQNGDPEKISRGKRAIIYALIGLAVALSAELIVIFVLGNL